MKTTKALLHIFAVALLTLITQIGGVVWIMNFGFYNFKKIRRSLSFRAATFVALYLIVTFLIIPPIAKLNNRVPLPISKSGNIVPHNYITPILNRNYVRPKLNSELIKISAKVNSENENLKVSYLDANFPFIDGFPLLPHLSHNDGRKVDLSFFYTKDNKPGNLKPSNSGYGKFVALKGNESNQTETCKSKGHWQYDFTKYLTLGSRDDLEFDSQSTKRLITTIVNAASTHKLLIEPNLKKRMRLDHNKIRFQGCHAVRHDDHIHYQIK